MTVKTHYLLPHERWLTERKLHRDRADPRLDIASFEMDEGTETNRLDTAYFVDFGVGVITILAGGLVMAVVAGALRAVAAGLVAGYFVMGIGFASFILAAIRLTQRSLARQEYQRTKPPSPFIGE
jgi:hypothetical protein